MQITPQEAVDQIKSCLMAGLVPMVSSPPGTGKSDIIRQVFDSFKLKEIDVRLSQYDPVELAGYPSIKDGRASHIPLDVFPLKENAIPKDYNGWGLFFDEFNSASLATQAAAYKVILDKHIGQYPLHDRVRIVCAGNLATDSAIVNRLSTAMQSRLVHLELTVDVEQWVQWANSAGLDHRVIAYIQSVPDNLHKFEPDHNDKTFSSPRTWEFASKLIAKDQGNLQPKLPLLAGAVSEAVAREFILYTAIYTDMPTINEILAKPDTIAISNEPGTLYALSNMVAAWAKPSNIDILMKFINRLPIEFATITLQNLIHRNTDMVQELSVAKWINTYAPDLF